MIGIGSCRKYNLRSPHMTFTSSYAVADMSGSLPSTINQMKKLRQYHLLLLLIKKLLVLLVFLKTTSQELSLVMKQTIILLATEIWRE